MTLYRVRSVLNDTNIYIGVGVVVRGVEGEEPGERRDLRGVQLASPVAKRPPRQQRSQSLDSPQTPLTPPSNPQKHNSHDFRLLQELNRSFVVLSEQKVV